LNILKEKPTAESKYGKAWRIDVTKMSSQHTTIVGWILHCPWAHPMWANYALAIVHLREAPGIKDAHKKFPEATHEIQVLALHPDWNGDPYALSMLMPPNLIEQATFIDDIAASQWLGDRIQQILRAELSPDSDYRKAWQILVKTPDAKLEYRPYVRFIAPDVPKTKH
jgi:hypothetical protein